MCNDPCPSAGHQLFKMRAHATCHTSLPHGGLCCLQKSGRKCFDSADFALQQQGRLSTIVSGDLSVPEQPIETLAPKLSPTQPAPRRMSNLGDSE